MDLKRIISIKDYRTFAGPDWPAYDSIVAGTRTDNVIIQQEVDEFVAMMQQTFDELSQSGDSLAQQNQISEPNLPCARDHFFLGQTRVA